VSHAYLRLVDDVTGTAPSSHRILQDMLDFGSDIKTDSATKSKGRKRKFVIAQSDDEDIKDEENDYEILDEEVLCVLLGLNENIGSC
jgi:hypothetical protein